MNTINNDIPHLSPEYYKARKNYNLFVGLLFIWEFVGVELSNMPIQNINIKLKSPDAAPYVLLTLLIFYSYRVTIEWHQSNFDRRTYLQSKVDYFISHFLAFSSVIIFLIQSKTGKQIFEIIFIKETFQSINLDFLVILGVFMVVLVSIIKIRKKALYKEHK